MSTNENALTKMQTFYTLSQALIPKLMVVRQQTTASDFDTKFNELKAELIQWKELFPLTEGLTPELLDVKTRLAKLLVKILAAVRTKSIELGATEGREEIKQGGSRKKRRQTKKKTRKHRRS